MRKLSDHPDQDSAQSLSDYLEIEGISSQVRDGQGSHAVWIIHETEMERARELHDSYSPSQGKALRSEAEALRKKKAKDARPVFTPQRVGRRAAANESWGAGVIFLFGVCGLVALLSQLGSKQMLSLYIAPVDMSRGVFLPFDFRQPWRLITPSFLHFGLMHIVFNMMWLRQLGGQVEANAGTWRFILLFLVTSASSNLAQYWLFHPQFGGMSGVNYALFGYVWMQARYSTQKGYSISSGTTWLMMGWLVLCGTGMMGPVANAAHAFGLVSGLVLAFPTYLRFRKLYNVSPRMEAGSWQNQNIKGFARFRRLYLEPFAPAWFLVVALMVVALDYF